MTSLTKRFLKDKNGNRVWAKAHVTSVYDDNGTPLSTLLDSFDAATVNNHTVQSDVPANAVFTDTTYSAATPSTSGTGGTDGLLTAQDKEKLNGIEAGAQAHIAPTSTEVKSALGTGSGTTKFLREDGTWQTPDYPTSLPASDVSAWAKAATKPNYTLSEVGYSASVVAISSATSSSCSVTGAGNAGKQETIIYTNSTGGDLVVTVPTTYTTPDGQAIELTCPSGGYVEVSYINISGTIYARGL